MYLIAPFIPLIIGFLYRKRLVAWFARQIGPYIAQSVVSWAFTTEEVESEDGTKTQRRAVSAPAKALLAATVPVIIAEALKSIKFKPGAGAGAGGMALPAGLDLSDLSSALPAILPMLPKKYQGLVALAAPFLQGMLSGGKGAAVNPQGYKMSEITKKLIP